MTVKSQVLRALEANRGRFVSGQQLAETLKVSRNAVWKAVNTLKSEGYEIISVKNRGYSLLESSDMLSKTAISAFLKDEYCNIPIYIYKEIDSTNDQAKRLIADGLSGSAVILAEHQTAGKGRRGRPFYSPYKTGLYMSLVFQPKNSISEAVYITSAAAVAVVLAIENLTGKSPKIKWVNDIYLDGKKVCGILTEAVTNIELHSVQNIVVGIGINISTQEFPQEISSIAGSLNPQNLSRNRLAAEIINLLLDFAENPNNRTYLSVYKSRSMVIGREIYYYKDDEVISATALAINNDGSLAVRNADGSISTLRSGEITLRLKK